MNYFDLYVILLLIPPKTNESNHPEYPILHRKTLDNLASRDSGIGLVSRNRFITVCASENRERFWEDNAIRIFSSDNVPRDFW